MSQNNQFTNTGLNTEIKKCLAQESDLELLRKYPSMKSSINEPHNPVTVSFSDTQENKERIQDMIRLTQIKKQIQDCGQEAANVRSKDLQAANLVKQNGLTQAATKLQTEEEKQLALRQKAEAEKKNGRRSSNKITKSRSRCERM